MKKIYTILAAILLSTSTFAQAPEKMSYQAVVRDSGDVLITNQAVGMQISILQGSATGTAVYTETQTPTSNINGLVTLEIGTGTTSDVFSAIDWVNGPYFIKTETDPSGGANYTITGTSQLLSVPYALYAKTSGSPNYKGTSTTSIDLTNFGDCTSFFFPGCASGTASFTTTTELNYTPGMRIRLFDSANPTTNYFEGIIQTYDGINMTVAVDTSYGTGTYSSWDINLGNGLPGYPGPKGDNGQTAAECFDYTFDSSTSASPFDGTFRFNSTALNTSTQIYVHNNDSNFISQLDYFNLISNNSSTIKGTIMVSQDSYETLFAINNVTDNTGYQTLDVSYLSGATTPSFNNFSPITLCFGRTGDKGDSGFGDGKNIFGSPGVSDPNLDVSSPNEGDQWVNSETGESYIYQNGVWEQVPPKSDAKNFLGSSSETIVEGTDAILSGMDRAPIEGDQWIDIVNGTSYIFKDGAWSKLPSSSNGLTSTVQTTDDTNTTLAVFSPSTSDTLYYVESKVLAKRSDFPGEGVSYKITSIVLNNAGTLTLLGTTSEIMDSGMNTWAASHQISGPNIILSVTGELAKVIDWKAVTEIIEN